MRFARKKIVKAIVQAGDVDAGRLSIELPSVFGHPNRHPFEGCLTIVDSVSDKSPSGARGHRVILTRDAAIAALPSLLGMAVDFKAAWDGHDARQKCGIITSASIDGKQVMVRGFIFGRDYPEFASKIDHLDLGMSYELADAHVADMRTSIWTLTRATFTGAAILLREKAAYRSTRFTMLDKAVRSSSAKYGTRAAQPIALSGTAAEGWG